MAASIQLCLLVVVMPQLLWATNEVDGVSDVPKTYLSTLTDEALKKTPSWVKGAENPPVSARSAIKLATAVKDRLVKDSGRWKWHYFCIHLQYRDYSEGKKWYWRVRFEALSDGSLPAVPPTVEVFVLMDGTTTKPVEYKPNE